MRNCRKKRKIAQFLNVALLISLLPIASFAAINDRIEYKVNRILNQVIQINNTVNPSCSIPDETYDFVIVGAGNTGCVLANRLSEDGQYSVCILDAGRDDARLPDLLPEPSTAPVPQPGDFHWGKYVRGQSTIFSGVPGVSYYATMLWNRGFGAFCFYQKNENRPNGVTSTSYARHAGWGGCTSHNFCLDVRNAPYNWDEWVNLGLTDWDASTPSSNLIQYYKKKENRSQSLFGTTVNLYNPALPPGSFSGFDPDWYGFDGKVPMGRFFPGDFTSALVDILNTTLSSFGYPSTIVDLDYPPTASNGGVSEMNQTMNWQVLDPTLTRPGTAPAPGDFSNNIPFADYNFPLYGDDGFRAPSEFQALNIPALNPGDLATMQRASAANTYLYEAENRDNLTIKSEVLVTNLIMDGTEAKGVEYYKGWNIYQTGRNPNTLVAGYGGTVADAKLNGIEAKKCKGKVYANKAVVLCAGAYNTPQILMLSGIGNKFDLEPLGIKSVYHLPGVGQHLIDNQEFFIGFQLPEGTPNVESVPIISAFVNPTDSVNGIPPYFDLFFVPNVISENNESEPTIQKGWNGLKNTSAIGNTFVRNTVSNILLDTKNPTSNPGPITITSAGAPTPTGLGSWAVTFTIPASTLSQGGYTVSGNDNPNYNGKFTSLVPANNIPGQTSITLLYPSDPGIYGGGVTTIKGDPAFIPIMTNPSRSLTLVVEQEDKNLTEGYVKLQSADPTVPPLIVFNYLSNPQDLDVWKKVMMNTVFPLLEALQSTTPVYMENLILPSPNDILYDGTDPLAPFATSNVDPAKLETYLLNHVGGHHAGGTCKMGTVDDPNAVVDQQGKVFGIENVYVADMSVVPVSIRWPNGTCYIIGEKISDDILAAYA